jgi:hypothetical protein
MDSGTAPNFQNYANIAGPRLLQGLFSVDSSDNQKLSVDSLLEGVLQPFAATGLRIQQDEDGFLVTGNPPSAPMEVADRVTALLSYVQAPL